MEVIALLATTAMPAAEVAAPRRTPDRPDLSGRRLLLIGRVLYLGWLLLELFLRDGLIEDGGRLFLFGGLVLRLFLRDRLVVFRLLFGGGLL